MTTQGNNAFKEGQLVWVSLNGETDQDCWFQAVYLRQLPWDKLHAVAIKFTFDWSIHEVQDVIPRAEEETMPPMEAIRPFLRPFLNEVEP